MRANRGIAFIIILIVALSFVEYFDFVRILSTSQVDEKYGFDLCTSKSEVTYKSLKCSINGYTSPGCYHLNNSALAVDFDHIKYWYEIEGYLDLSKGVFYMFTGGEQSNLPLPLATHEPFGHYLGQHSWSTPEGKSHILLVDAELNIPISRQWDPRGYPYPIQIAQFGLAYYGQYRNLLNLELLPNVSLYHAVVDLKLGFADQLVCSRDSFHCLFGVKPGSVNYSLVEKDKAHNLTALLANGINWPRETRLVINASLLMSTRRHVQIHFACSNNFGEGNVVMANKYWILGYSRSVDLKAVFLLRDCRNVTLMQNLEMVILKAIECISRDPGARPRFGGLLNGAVHKYLVVDAVELKYPQHSEEAGLMQTLLLFVPIAGEKEEEVASMRHLTVNIMFARQRFMATAEWLVKNQALDGSWRVFAKRTFTRDIYLKPGWCSAMAQGQAISLLVRAGHASGDERFLMAANRALEPFNRSVSLSKYPTDEACGVRTNFLDHDALPWYEEYPVVPGIFVLNGFIYSLIGLYDLSKVSGAKGNDSTATARASRLLEEGIVTLTRVLPLYDSGTGSFYDLRHLSLAHAFRLSPLINRLVRDGQWGVGTGDRTLKALLKAGPNRARWQYHRLHLLQLYQLAAAVAPQHSDLWNMYFDRWLAYMWGFRSGHN